MPTCRENRWLCDAPIGHPGLVDPSLTPPSPYRSVTLSPDDADRMKTLEELVWFEVVPGSTAADGIDAFDFERGGGLEVDPPQHAGVGPDDVPPLAGIYGAYDMGLSVPGPLGSVARVSMNGLTWVGVHPDHRRKGILRSMMTEHLHGIHDRGDAALASLWAAEVGIYGRYGYGPASLEVMLTVSSGTEVKAPAHIAEAAAGITTHMALAHTAAAGEAVHRVQVAAAQHHLGSITRPESIAGLWFRDTPKARVEKEPRQVVFAVRDGEPVGYAVIRRTSKWDDHNNPEGEMNVGEMAAVDPAALHALVSRLLSFDLISKIRLYARSTDDPLLWWVGGPRTTTTSITDGLWVRLVDVPRALNERGYAASCDLVIGVTDATCEWNVGNWHLVVGDDGVGRCQATKAPADLELDVAVLGSAYLGGRSIASLAQAGFAVEHTHLSVGRLSRAMRADVEPLGTFGF